MSWFGDILVWIVMSGYKVWWFDNLIKVWHVPFRVTLLVYKNIFQSCVAKVLNVQTFKE
jgi:hypothetical protein